MKPRKVLVTGANGFVGSYLTRLLVRNGYSVRAIYLDGTPKDLVQEVEAEVEWVPCDIRDKARLKTAFSGITDVCHCAALVSFKAREVDRMMEINVGGTANLIDQALESGVQKFVHVSSVAALGRSTERPHLDEQSEWIPNPNYSQYQISKYRSEQEVWRGHKQGLPVAIVNPTIILGSGYWDIGSCRMFKQIHKGLALWPIGHNGVVDVRDVAGFMFRMLESNATGQRYILNARNISFRELFFQIADAVGAKRPFIRVTPFMVGLTWRIEWLKEKILGMEPIVTRDSSVASISHYTFDNSKSLTVPGFRYRAPEDTIKQTSRQFLEAVQEGLCPRVLDF
ncbi:MAG: SDR family NAD(P)-dependent oxidoreductase [Bacteroidetes bacterium]|nr:MAG: SDR family NAD(P)-dependent oxidoreductase [Bacteroidota bacterium]